MTDTPPNGYSPIEPLYSLELTETMKAGEIVEFLLESSSEAMLALMPADEAASKRAALISVRGFMGMIFEAMNAEGQINSLNDGIRECEEMLAGHRIPAPVYYHEGTVTPLSILGAEALIAKQLGSVRIYSETDPSLTVNLTPEESNV